MKSNTIPKTRSRPKSTQRTDVHQNIQAKFLFRVYGNLLAAIVAVVVLRWRREQFKTQPCLRLSVPSARVGFAIPCGTNGFWNFIPQKLFDLSCPKHSF